MAATYTWLKDDATGNYKASDGRAELIKHTRGWTLVFDGQHVKLAKKATFTHADIVLAAAAEAKDRAKISSREAVLEEIARRELRIETLRTRNSDSLDFHHCGVASLKAALEEAYAAGVRDAHRKEAPDAAR